MMKELMMSVVVGFLMGQTACLEVDEPESNAPIASEIMEVGQECDLAEGCGAGLRCDPVIDEGQTIAAVCLVDQGQECNVDYDLCGRGLKCSPVPADTASPAPADTASPAPAETGNPAPAEADKFMETDKFICLPGGCIDDSECPVGLACHNFECFHQTSCDE